MEPRHVRGEYLFMLQPLALGIDATRFRPRFIEIGRYDDAITHLQEAVRLDPNFSDAYFELSQIWEARRDRSVAMMYLNQAARRGHSAAKQRLQQLLASR